tara:strand:- start:415 stop:1968 length:1554 start_codon:yes stop_codon:yes gene_type:complete
MSNNPIFINIDLVDQFNTGLAVVKKSFYSTARVRSSTIRSGFLDKKITHTITGFIPNNRTVTIATCYFFTKDSTEFDKKPFVLSSTDGLTLIEKYNKENKYLIYDLVYLKNKNPLGEKINATLHYERYNQNQVKRIINKVYFGSNTIKPTGETRPIKVYGTPGLVVDIAVNKVDNILDADGNIVNSIESSILNGKAGVLRNLSEIATFSNGVAMTTVTKTIPQSGNCTVLVDFPSIKVKKTKINGAVARGKTTTLDDNSDIRVGDIMYFGKTRLSRVSAVSTVSNQIVTDQPIVISDNVGVVFEREIQYNINVYCNNTTGTNYKSGLSSKIVNTDPTFVLNQFNNPALCLEILAGSNHSITHVDDVAVDGAGNGVDYYASYLGRANATYGQLENTSNTFRKATIKLTINASGSQAFTANRVPFFSGRSITNISDNTNTPTTSDFFVDNILATSDFTNTNPSDNGGTEFSISNASSVLSADGGTANGICTLTFDLIIDKWGTKDFKVTLDLDDLLTSA